MLLQEAYEAAVGFVTSIFEAAAGFVTSIVGIIILCGALLLWAVLALRTFNRRVSPVLNRFNKHYQALHRTEGEEGFAANFEELDEKFRDCPILGHSWREFSDTLIEPPDGDEEERFLTPYPAGQYFNRSTLLGPAINLRLYNALPNMLTGAGILGTFIGLVAGIYQASQGLGSADVGQAKESLEYLLNGAALAFLTSIVGLLSSIIFSVVEKRKVHSFDSLCNHWVEALDARLERVTPEKVALQGLAQSKQQTLAMQQFSDQLAFQLVEALEKAVTQPLQPIMGQVVDQLQALRDDHTKISDETLERLISEFSNSITGAAGEEMRAFSETIGRMSHGLQEQIGAMAESHERMQRSSQEAVTELTETFRESSRQLNEELSTSVREMVNQISNTVTEMTAELKKATETTTDNMNQIVERFDESVAKLRRSIADIQEVTTQTREVTEGLDGLISAMNDSHSSLAATAEPIRLAGEQFASTATTMGRSSQNMEHSSELMSNALNNLSGLQEKIKDSWEDYRVRFEGIDESLERVFDQLDGGLKRYAESTRDYMQGLDKHAGEVVRSLAGAVKELEQTIEELAEVQSGENVR